MTPHPLTDRIAHLIPQWRERVAELREIARANMLSHPEFAAEHDTRATERQICLDELEALAQGVPPSPEPTEAIEARRQYLEDRDALRIELATVTRQRDNVRSWWPCLQFKVVPER